MARQKRTGLGADASSDQRPRQPGLVIKDDVRNNQAEYDDRLEQDFEPTLLTQRIYAKESESLKDWIKRLWQEYGYFPASNLVLRMCSQLCPYKYCRFRRMDPTETLKQIPVQVLHNFFHWVLHNRSDTLRAASSLQTY